MRHPTALWDFLMSTLDSRVRAQMVQPFQGFEDLIRAWAMMVNLSYPAPTTIRRLQSSHDIKL